MEKIDAIFISSLPDTDDFKPILEGLDANLLVNPSRSKIRAMLRENFDRPLLIFGHGTERGLLTTDWKGYLIDGKMVDMLRKRKSIIGCWCFAGTSIELMQREGKQTKAQDNENEVQSHSRKS